ncbi:RNA polymerase sigma factor [Maribacter algicola]|uniref:RNA polymerase sigma factor n=1 Tax=Meishania litoralis TaxID=3434685 RepID=A0ACC7LNP1_9FLAO
MVTTFSKNIFRALVTEGHFLPSKGYMPTDTDRPYIEKVLDGDTTAFAVLVNRYKDMVFTLALKMIGNREEAEEVSQDTFIKIYEKLNGFKGDSKFSTWVYRITYNSCLDRIKKNRKERDTLTINAFTENQIPALETAFDIMERSDRKKVINECLDKLPGEDSMVILLYYYDELSLAEISEVIGVGQNHAKVKLFRARKRLATILRQRLEPTILENYGAKSG